MSIEEAAKNLLLNKSCFNCYHRVLKDETNKDAEINTCRTQFDSHDNSYKDFPSEFICKKWLHENWPIGYDSSGKYLDE